MPLPTPLHNEEKNVFVSRFMKNKEAKKKFRNWRQRVAVAYDIWREERE